MLIRLDTWKGWIELLKPCFYLSNIDSSVQGNCNVEWRQGGRSLFCQYTNFVFKPGLSILRKKTTIHFLNLKVETENI